MAVELLALVFGHAILLVGVEVVLEVFGGVGGGGEVGEGGWGWDWVGVGLENGVTLLLLLPLQAAHPPYLLNSHMISPEVARQVVQSCVAAAAPLGHEELLAAVVLGAACVLFVWEENGVVLGLWWCRDGGCRVVRRRRNYVEHAVVGGDCDAGGGGGRD